MSSRRGHNKQLALRGNSFLEIAVARCQHVARVDVAHFLTRKELRLHAGRHSGIAGLRFEGGGGGAGISLRRAPQSIQATFCGKRIRLS